MASLAYHRSSVAMLPGTDPAQSPPHSASFYSRVVTSPITFWLVVVTYASWIGIGGKRFLLWSQITDLRGASVWAACTQLHPHTPRLFLMQPVLWLAAHGVDQDLAFSAMCLLCLSAGAWLIAATVGAALECEPLPLRLPAFLGLGIPALFMGGRMVPAFFAVSLLLATHRRRPALGWNLAAHALAILFASVASGSVAVVIALVLLAGIEALVGHLPTMTTRGRTLSLVGFGLVGSALIALVMTYTDKALRCFAGDPWALLSQGWGTAVLGIRERTGDGPVLALLAGGVAWAGWWTWTGGRRGRPGGIGLQRIERGALTIPFVIGLTGFNSWSLIIPGALVAALVWWHQSPRSSQPRRRD